MPTSEPEYQQQIQSLQERLQLQVLISDLSTILIDLPPSEVDGQIEQGLKRIVEFLGVERCAFGEFSADMKEMRVTHTYGAPGIAPSPGVVWSEVLPWYAAKLRRGEIFKLEHPDDLPEEAVAEKAHCQKTGLKSNLTIPVSIGGSVICGISYTCFRACRSWPDELVEQLRRVAEIFGHAIYRKRAEEKLQESFNEIKQLKDRLQAEADYLKAEIKVNHRYGNIVGESAAIRQVLSLVEQVAPTHSSVLISGETGAGKELIARAIHKLSPRKDRLMVTVNCAALPSTLIESELFGREKGAYTGALTKQMGRFEAAEGSTIFLDEIGELSLELQAKLLRVLQEGEFERLGSPKTIKVDVRVIAATNRDLTEARRNGGFREDLYYRLNVFPITMPPLRERREDISPLVYTFVKEFAEKMGKRIPTVSPKTMTALQQYRWPGNIRELRNVIEHAVIISAGNALQVRLPENSHGTPPGIITLEESERQHITKILEMTHWRIKGQNGAAQLLGLEPSTLYGKMNKLGIPKRNDKDHI